MAVETLRVKEAGESEGVPVAADQISGGKLVQYVKLMDGTDASAVPIKADASGNLLVNITGYGETLRCSEITLDDDQAAVALNSLLAGGAALTGRKSLMLINTGLVDAKLGSSTAQFWPLAAGIAFSQDWGPGVNPYLILSVPGETTIVVLETA